LYYTVERLQKKREEKKYKMATTPGKPLEKSI